MAKSIFTWTIVLIVAASIAVSVYFVMNIKDNGLLGDVHEHADFKVYLDGVAYDFSNEKYISAGNSSLSNFVHLHDASGEVIHKHAAGITMRFFFNTLNMGFNSTCFVLDDQTAYCSAGEKRLKMYVNGKQNYEYGDYEPKDIDRILVTYGDEDESVINQQIDSVTDKSCIQSGKCPERGTPINESSCLTEGGCGAET